MNELRTHMLRIELLYSKPLCISYYRTFFMWNYFNKAICQKVSYEEEKFHTISDLLYNVFSL